VFSTSRLQLRNAQNVVQSTLCTPCSCFEATLFPLLLDVVLQLRPYRRRKLRTGREDVQDGQSWIKRWYGRRPGLGDDMDDHCCRFSSSSSNNPLSPPLLRPASSPREHSSPKDRSASPLSSLSASLKPPFDLDTRRLFPFFLRFASVQQTTARITQAALALDEPSTVIVRATSRWP
jgi:hypothetical protein